MRRTRGSADIRIALLDGPVDRGHRYLQGADIVPARRVPHESVSAITAAHGTFLAGLLVGQDRSSSPSICPECTLVVRPIYGEGGSRHPRATPDELADALVEAVDAGARLIQVSAAIGRPSLVESRELTSAFDDARSRGVIVVAATGNNGSLGTSMITRDAAVLPVTGCDLALRPLRSSTTAPSIGRRGLAAPATQVRSLAPGDGTALMGGTSVAAGLVVGALALLWSARPQARRDELLGAIREWRTSGPHLFPPPLHAERAWAALCRRPIGAESLAGDHR
ncbi:MAG: S8 family serine peptidase [Blastococcus sp.]